MSKQPSSVIFVLCVLLLLLGRSLCLHVKVLLLALLLGKESAVCTHTKKTSRDFAVTYF